MSPDSVDDIAAYYRDSGEATRARVAQLEFAVTRALLARYLAGPRRRVLELGAGTGHHTAQLLGLGHEVTAVELVESLAAKIPAAARVVVADAREFSATAPGPFDAALVMGPLYHLVAAPERLRLLETVRDAVVPGGMVITTHLSRVGLVGYMLARFPGWPLDSPEQFQEIIEKGFFAAHPRNGAFRGYWTTVEEIRALHEAAGLAVTGIHCQDPCIAAVDELFNRLPADAQEKWAELLTAVSADPLALGSGRSLMCVGTTPTGSPFARR